MRAPRCCSASRRGTWIARLTCWGQGRPRGVHAHALPCRQAPVRLLCAGPASRHRRAFTAQTLERGQPAQSRSDPIVHGQHPHVHGCVVGIPRVMSLLRRRMRCRHADMTGLCRRGRVGIFGRLGPRLGKLLTDRGLVSGSQAAAASQKNLSGCMRMRGEQLNHAGALCAMQQRHACVQPAAQLDQACRRPMGHLTAPVGPAERRLL